jgi:HSP20 family protein
MSNQQEYPRCGAYGRKAGGYGQGAFARNFRSVPVNIQEKQDAFILQLFAPGLDKQFLKISAKDDILSISYNNPKEDEQNAESPAFTRREYAGNSFERSFLLKGKVDLELVSATYSEGILTVDLPKDPERNTTAKNFQVR